MMKTDIQNKTDIKNLVDSFYEKVRADNLLAPIFAEKLGKNWQEHLETMYSFWNTLLFGETDYKGAPFDKHAHLPVQAVHFERWVALFCQTVDAFFQGEKATEAMQKAENIARVFAHRIANMQHKSHE